MQSTDAKNSAGTPPSPEEAEVISEESDTIN